jgi:hypothetical protein
MENAGARMKSALTSIASKRPFGPTDGNAQDDEGNEIGEHEGSAAVLRGQTGEAQKISEANGAARNRQNNTETRTPAFFGFSGDHWALVLSGYRNMCEAEIAQNDCY